VVVGDEGFVTVIVMVLPRAVVGQGLEYVETVVTGYTSVTVRVTST